MRTISRVFKESSEPITMYEQDFNTIILEFSHDLLKEIILDAIGNPEKVIFTPEEIKPLFIGRTIDDMEILQMRIVPSKKNPHLICLELTGDYNNIKNNNEKVFSV